MTPSLQEQRYDELTGLCYECVLDNSAWPVLLDKLLVASGRQQGMLTLWENGAEPQVSSIFQCNPASVAAFRRYSGRIDNAPTSAARSATQNASQSKFVSSHLCGLVQ